MVESDTVHCIHRESSHLGVYIFCILLRSHLNTWVEDNGPASRMPSEKNMNTMTFQCTGDFGRIEGRLSLSRHTLRSLNSPSLRRES